MEISIKNREKMVQEGKQKYPYKIRSSKDQCFMRESIIL
jgi:hypothetical protein